MTLYQHAKNQVISSFYSRNIFHLKILLSDFGPYLRNSIFPKYGIYAGIWQIIETFTIDQIQGKLKTKFSINSRNPMFDPFLGKNFFKKNPTFSCTISYGFLAPCQNLEKTGDPTPRKCLDRQMDRSYFIGSFWLPPWVQRIYPECFPIWRLGMAKLQKFLKIFQYQIYPWISVLLLKDFITFSFVVCKCFFSFLIFFMISCNSKNQIQVHSH